MKEEKREMEGRGDGENMTRDKLNGRERERAEERRCSEARVSALEEGGKATQPH